MKARTLHRTLLAICLSSISTAQTLREAADRAGILIGTAVRPSHLAEQRYASTLSREFNMVTAEDAMKWQTLRPTEDTYDFSTADALIDFAHAHGMKVRGHCLVWGRDNPEWLTKGRFTPEQLSDLLHEHIAVVMKHYSGEVLAWDVVNEALDENGRLRDTIWYSKPGIGFAGRGDEYIAQVFRWAHRSDPHALLFYNEAEGEFLNPKSDAIYALIKRLKHSGVPIDGIGLQMHISTLDGNPGSLASALSANIARIAALGLQVHITELDVSLLVDAEGRASSVDLARQAELYRLVVRACLQNPSCTAIQTWGFTDKYSWIRSHSRGSRGDALPFDNLYQPKPAYAAFLKELLEGAFLQRHISTQEP